MVTITTTVSADNLPDLAILVAAPAAGSAETARGWPLTSPKMSRPKVTNLRERREYPSQPVGYC